MQVDEEVKGQAANKSVDLDIGGYEDDSDDEREIKEQEEGHKDIHLRLSEAGKAQVATIGANPATLVVCSCPSSQSLARIMYGAEWQEVGEATSTKTSTKDSESAKDNEPKTIMTLYAFNAGSPFYFALPDLEKMSGAAVSPIVNQIFG